MFAVSCPVEELIYGKKYDNALRQGLKQGGAGGAPEATFENESVKEEWSKVEAQLEKEASERKAQQQKALGLEEGDEEGPGEEVLMKRAPNQHPVNTEEYWMSVAYQTMRTYCTLLPEPKTLDGVASAISQAMSLKDITGTVVAFLDIECLGETMGPGCAPCLRKQFQAEPALLRKLIQGCMLGRGGQKENPEGEVTKVPREDIVAIHCGFDRKKKEAKDMFRLCASKVARYDSELKDLLLAFSDDSIRSRKKKVKGSYSTRSPMVVASHVPLTQLVPERAYQHHSGFNTSDTLGFIRALQPSDMWHSSRPGASIKALNFRFDNLTFWYRRHKHFTLRVIVTLDLT